MGRKSNFEIRQAALERAAVVALGLYVASVGLHALGTGRWMYPNYLHWPVAAPIAIAIGIVLITAGLWIRR